MQYITGNNRYQSYFSTLEDQVAADNALRLIDAFADKLDLPQLGFKQQPLKSEGLQNYYCHFIKRNLNDLWRFVNRRLEKWCKWNKRLSLRKSRKWLNTLYKMQPGLFAHWSVCPAY